MLPGNSNKCSFTAADGHKVKGVSTEEATLMESKQKTDAKPKEGNSVTGTKRFKVATSKRPGTHTSIHRYKHVPGYAKVNCNDSESHSCQSHSFFTDVTDVRRMEQGLLQLLDDFHSGKLQAFGQDITFEKMDSVREQQEKLARLHFDLNTQHEIYGHDSEDGRRIAKENMLKLTENLQQLSHSIEQLQSRASKSTS